MNIKAETLQAPVKQQLEWAEYAKKGLERAVKNSGNPRIQEIYQQELNQVENHITYLKTLK